MASVKFTARTKAQAVELYLDGLGYREVSERVGCSPGAVRQWVLAAGHTPRPRGRAPMSIATRLKAVSLYEEGMSSPAVARAVGVTSATVLRWVHEHGLPIDPTYKPLPDKYRALVVELYQAGESMDQVARRVGVSQCTVWRWLREAGIEARPVGGWWQTERAIRRNEAGSD